jgi:NAD(P)-dependent dehydrogenase (short-subunit alcohol dehydrogenase family)
MQGGDDEYSKVGLTARGEMLKGKWALITGASRGVGWTIAEKFASEQANLILVARSKDDLEKVLRLPADRCLPQDPSHKTAPSQLSSASVWRHALTY